MSETGKIQIIVVDSAGMRGRGTLGSKEIEVDVLASNVTLFLTQIQTILGEAPDEVGKFRFTEFTISAEVTAKGQLALLGSGVEAGATAGLTFKFERVA